MSTVQQKGAVSLPHSTLTSASGGGGAAKPGSVPLSQRNSEFSVLTENEKSDPCGVALLLSNDVLEDEQNRINAMIAAARAGNHVFTNETEDLESLNMRLQMVTTKLTLLVNSVQNESISFEDYLSMIKERLSRDVLVYKYYQTHPNGEEQDAETLKILKRRIAIMQKEIKEAEASIA
jgi:hypothetical protein